MGIHLKKARAENLKMNKNFEKEKNSRKGRALELSGVWAQAECHLMRKKMYFSFFRALALKSQGQEGTSETRNFMKDRSRKNKNGQLPKIKLGN